MKLLVNLFNYLINIFTLGTLQNKVKGRHTQARGAPMQLSKKFERILKTVIEIGLDWQVPLTMENLKYTVQR